VSELVPTSEIERLVGAPRHETEHMGRAVSSKQVVYVLHSQECFDSGVDLRDCPFSLALDEFGIDTDGAWCGREDEAVVLDIVDGELVPALPKEPVTEASDD